MRSNTIPHTVVFPELFDTPLIATFDEPHVSSDGGAVLLTTTAATLGLGVFISFLYDAATMAQAGIHG